jgi:lysozyme family protein
MSIDSLIDGVIEREGGYSNNPNDSGGETMWGVTIRVARANGYAGPMKDMPREVAKNIYFSQYVQKPGFASIMPLSNAIADIKEDGDIGPGTVAALKAYLGRRGKQGEQVLLKALNCLQGARYIELARGRSANEAFLFGWLANRVVL